MGIGPAALAPCQSYANDSSAVAHEDWVQQVDDKIASRTAGESDKSLETCRAQPFPDRVSSSTACPDSDTEVGQDGFPRQVENDTDCVSSSGTPGRLPKNEKGLDDARMAEFLREVMGAGPCGAGPDLRHEGTIAHNIHSANDAMDASQPSSMSLKDSTLASDRGPPISNVKKTPAQQAIAEQQRTKGGKTRTTADVVQLDSPQRAGPIEVAELVLPRAKESQTSEIDIDNLTSPFGCVFVQREGRGVASYHFESPSQAYISYKKAKSGWVLDNKERFPKRKYFKKIRYDESSRTLCATIDWSPNTKSGNQRWDFEMVFNKSFYRISGGTIKMFPPNCSTFVKMARFGIDVEYRLLKDAQHQEQLVAMEKARQLLE